MLKSLRNNNEVFRRLNQYLAHLLVFIISFYQTLLPLFLVFFLVVNLIAEPWNNRVRLFKERKWFILIFSSYYLLHIVGMLYTDSVHVPIGMKDLETKFSLLIVPLVVLSSNVINGKNVYDLLKTYVVGAVLAAAFSLLISTFTFIETDNTNVFYYKLLSYFQHPGYFSMYLNFAVAIILVLIFHEKGKLNLRYYVALTFSIVFIYQLSSRMGVIILAAMLGYSIMYLLFPKLKLKTTIISMLISLSVAIVVIWLSSGYMNRFDKAVNEFEQFDESSSAGSRIVMWKYSLELMKERPLLGYGTGDVDEVIQTKFEKEAFVYAASQHLNPHNQFIQAGVSLGLIGMLAFILPLILPFLFFSRNKNFLYPLFAFIVASGCLTESMFERQSGVVFFALFNALLFFTTNTTNHPLISKAEKSKE